MKTIQKLTLAVLMAASSTAFSSGTLVIEVDSGVATHSGAISAATVQKIGAGEVEFQGSFGAALQLSNGRAEINGASSMPSAVTFDTNAGNILEINQASLSVPALTMTTAGELLCTLDTALVGAPSGAALTVDAAANKVLTIGADLSAGTSAMIINSAATVAVGAASGDKMPASGAPAVTVAGILELKANMAGGYCAGANVINGTLLVDANVAVPAYAAASSSANTDFFNHWDSSASSSSGSLKFNSGATLKLGAGASWARAITVGTAL